LLAIDKEKWMSITSACSQVVISWNERELLAATGSTDSGIVP